MVAKYLEGYPQPLVDQVMGLWKTQHKMKEITKACRVSDTAVKNIVYQNTTHQDRRARLVEMRQLEREQPVTTEPEPIDGLNGLAAGWIRMTWGRSLGSALK